MRRRRHRGRSKHDVELNLAAMLDMAFQLLAFFILTFRPSPVEGELALNLPPPRAVARPVEAGQPPEGAGQITVDTSFMIGVRADGDTLRFLVSFRTAWSNPDDVVAKLMAIDPQTVLAGKGAATAKEIAAAHPGSPFAADYKAGLSGVMIPTAAVGILAAVAVPAFMDYMKKSKKTEASIQLNKLAKNLKVYHATNNAFPKAKVALTPAKSCCEGTGAKCFDATAWKNAPVTWPRRPPAGPSALPSPSASSTSGASLPEAVNAA